MKKIFAPAAALLSFSILFTGCTGYFSSTKENITIKDNLALHGSCIIAGKVVDSSTNEPIRGANIVVFSEPIHSVTDLYGQFEIIDMQPGKYTLQIFCVGYVQKDIPGIETKPDRFIRVEMRLDPRPDHKE
jgi:hypothetical protein